MRPLPLTCAFINECLRFRNIEPNGLPHKATVDQQVNGVMIREGTAVIVPLYAIMFSEKSWQDPHAFMPQRFLDHDGNFVSKPNPCYVPFGDGRRSCPGNKLAVNVMFLVLTRFLQQSSRIDVVGGVTDKLLRGDLSQTLGLAPNDYSLLVTP